MLVFIKSEKQKLKKKKKNDIYYKLYNIYIKKIDRYY